MIKFNDVSVKFGSFYALKDISFEINKGDFMHIVGPNGSGKTTLLKLLVDLLPPTGGTITRTPCTMGYLPQKTTINQKLPLTVAEVIYSGFPHPKLKPTKDEVTLMKKWLEKLEIGHLYNHSVRYLSGGQQQRVYIIRALISDPCLIVLDEPTSALDPSFREKFYEILKDIHQQRQATIINVTHDLTDAASSGDRTIYIDSEIRFCGTFDEFAKFEHESHHHV
ncbi:MAG TPA: ABC transporter ATP-binding protein [Firmicutes bacterium]|jgi:zinc transport system ATP-binding protein|nr:ABC transporter ATP-binding protein [Bacillota bacterium]